MKDNLELELSDVFTCCERIEVDYANRKQINADVVMWFDIEKKFADYYNPAEAQIMGMVAKYNPFKGTIILTCEVWTRNGVEYFDYIPSPNEAKILKYRIVRTLRDDFYKGPRAFCASFYPSCF